MMIRRFFSLYSLKSCAVLGVAAGLAFPHPGGATFDLLDDFETYEPGNVSDDADSPWTAHNNTGLFTIFEEDDNRFLAYTWQSGIRAGSRPLPAGMQVGPGEAATLFVQFRAGNLEPGAHGGSFGLSHDVDTGTHNPSGDLRVEARVAGGPSPAEHLFQVRDGDQWRTLTTVSRGFWYNVWFVIDRSDGDGFRLYLTPASAPEAATEADRLVYDGGDGVVDTFAFRDGGSPDEVLDGFVAYGESTSGANRSVNLDNLWMDNTGENLAFAGEAFDAWVTAFEEISAPFDVDFGTGAGQGDGENLLRNRPQDFTLQPDSLRYLPASGSFLSSGALAVVDNYVDRQDFVLESDLVLNQIAEAGSNRAGFAVLGGPHDPALPFDIGEESGFYGLVWYPGESDETSHLRIREGFNGSILAEAVWEGASPFPQDADTLFFEDFEDAAAAEAAWTSGGDENNWEVGVPVAGPGDAVSGDNVAATGLDDTYAAHTNAWFRSPAIDLNGVQSGTLSFWEYTDVDDEGVEFHSTTVSILDAQTLEVVDDGELSRDADQTGEWRFRELDLPPDAFGREIVVEFRLESDGAFADTHQGWFIDDVEVTGGFAGDPMAYHIRAEGSFDPAGTLTLALTLTDGEGHDQTVTANVAEPFEGNLFGFGGRSRAADMGDPVFDFGTLSLALGEAPDPLDPVINAPFNFAFGSDDDRIDTEGSLRRSLPDEWSLIEEAARLEAAYADYVSSLGTVRVMNFEPAGQFVLSTAFTLTDLSAAEGENRVGLVLFGDADGDVFNPDDDATYYTFQWLPNPSGGARIALREGMDGAIVTETAFADLDHPPAGPEAGTGGTYHLRFQGTYNGDGNLEYLAVLADESGGKATLSGVLADPPGGNRFGVGARHREAGNAVWDFHRLDWLASPASSMPLVRQFGSGSGRDSDDGFLKSGHLADGWSLETESLRHERPGSELAELEFGDAAAAANIVDYGPGGEFAVRATVTPSGLEGLADDVRPVFLDFPDAEDYVALGTEGMDVDSGTIEFLVYFVGSPAVWFYAQHDPEDQWANRLQIKRDSIGFGDDSGAINVSGDIEPYRWLRLSLVYDETSLRYYVDGDLRAEGSRPSGFESWSQNAYLMNVGPVGDNDRGPNARVVDVRHWNYPRTQEEIQDDTHAELAGTEAGLVGYWPLNEGRGDTVFDRTGNGNDGTIVGAQWRVMPQFGVTVLGESPGSTDSEDTSIRFRWLPLNAAGGGELRFDGPGDHAGPSLALDGVSGAPEFESGETYTIEVRGFHNAGGGLDLTGVVSDGNGAEASLVYQVEGAATGNWFGLTGSNPSLDWLTFEMGTPEQLGIDPPDVEPVTFDDWRSAYFDANELDDESISGPGADPAGDGVANLLKFAFGLDPWVAVAGDDLPQAEVDEGRLRLTYLERRHADGIEIVPEASEDLDGWGSVGVTEVGRVPQGDFDRVTVEADLPDGAAKGFLRVNVTID